MDARAEPLTFGDRLPERGDEFLRGANRIRVLAFPKRWGYRGRQEREHDTCVGTFEGGVVRDDGSIGLRTRYGSLDHESLIYISRADGGPIAKAADASV